MAKTHGNDRLKYTRDLQDLQAAYHRNQKKLEVMRTHVDNINAEKERHIREAEERRKRSVVARKRWILLRAVGRFYINAIRCRLRREAALRAEQKKKNKKNKKKKK